MISYAQEREDVLLNRALQHVHHSEGFYVDVGGYDPNSESVTRHFYDHGWRGINIEPSAPLFPRFLEHRSRDINLQVAVTDHAGEVEFYDIESNKQLGTLEKRFADRHASHGHSKRSYVVPAMTLTQIFEQHAPATVHFLKIDVEGHEAAVIRGMDFQRFRPWILVIEATEPNDLSAPTYDEWDSIVCDAGYDFVYTSILNRYYVAREHSELGKHFAVPADDYVYAWALRERDEARAELDRANQRIAELERAASREFHCAGPSTGGA